jgi:glycerol-3-phosphate O-acyltransferase/dihydroxyacetone phosphate acyltransferase
MALGAVAENPNCGLKIVPCGMNYFHAHKFRSRAVVEFGTPLEVPPELVEAYKNGNRREAVAQMLDTIYNSLVAVTVTSPDYDTLMLIQAVRRLYNPSNKPLPLPMVVELNRRLVKGYARYKDDPRIISLKKSVVDYHHQLMALNVRDHQLEYAKFSIHKVAGMLIYRVTKLLLLSAGVIPGLVLFAPVFIVGKVISIRKAKEALAASTVKIQARDVVATWKLLVAMALAPTLYSFYTIAFTAWTYYNRVGGRVPEWMPYWAIIIFGYVFFPTITYAALRFGEVGMDILKSLRPLVLALNPSASNTLVRLRRKREELSTEVTQLINELGPEMFPDFDAQRIMHGGEKPRKSQHSDSTEFGSPTTPHTPSSSMYLQPHSDDSPSNKKSESIAVRRGGRPPSGNFPRNESFRNLANIGIFASHPATPNSQDSGSRSQSRPGSRQGFGGFFGSMGFTSANGFASGTDAHGKEDGHLDLNDVSQKIRGAMMERGRRRKNESVDEGGYDSDESGMSTPASSASSVAELGLFDGKKRV